MYRTLLSSEIDKRDQINSNFVGKILIIIMHELQLTLQAHKGGT